MKLRTQILLLLFLFGFAPLTAMVSTSLPFVLERLELFYHKAHLQNLRADFRDLDEHLASRHEVVRLLAKLPEPSLILGEEANQDDETLDQARVRYTNWVNQILRGHLDIIQILFLDDQANPRFWLELNPLTQRWEPTIHKPDMPSAAFFQNGMQQEFGRVSVSKISLNPAAAKSDPHHFMTLRLFSSIVGYGEEMPSSPMGAVVVNINVGGMAQAYRNTLWVTNEGAYLLDRMSGEDQPAAFKDFRGLEQIFAKGNLALWEEAGSQVIWAPLFMTEDSGPLWVGRAVDPSPVAQFRNNLIIRVLTIVLIALVVLLISARWIATSVSGFGQSLAEKIGRVLQQDEAVRFDWRGPHEVKDLGRQLTTLAETHARHTQELREHARQLEESNRYKSEFLANVSHELRTPLNSILLLSKILREGGSITGEQKQQLRVIHEAGTDLKVLIENILDLSRIEAGQASFNLEQIEIRQLIMELIELLKPQFEAKGLSFSAEYAHDLPESFISDRSKVRQILKNFLANALKFTAKGRVVIHVYRQSDDLRPLCFGVTDSGIGIPEEKHEVIFEAFKQADGSTSREYGGTGLGLSISRELAILLGAQIKLTSEQGRGATFTLCIPLAVDPVVLGSTFHVEERSNEVASPDLISSSHREEPAPEATGLTPEFNGHRVLLVDDDLRTLLALTPLLETWGLEVTAAGDGKEALETLGEDMDYELILMDSIMPEMDGYDTIRVIREDSRFREMVIIALSTKNTKEDRERCLDAGADDFLPKPVDAEKLKVLITAHLHKESHTL